jgi:tripartite ATP-independent transporter DctM subunit
MIVYASISETSLGALFMGGFLPGILVMGLYSACAALQAKFRGFGGRAYRVTWRSRLSALPKMIPGVFLILAVLGSIYAGVATPTEAAAIGALAAFFIGVVVYRSLGWHNIKEALSASLMVSGMIMLIIICAHFFAFTLTLLQIPQQITMYVSSLEISSSTVFALTCLLLVVLGCFIDGISMTLITTPILLPIMTSLGFDPVWYGVILMITIDLATITPPVGSNLYAIKAISGDISFGQVISGSFPFFLFECTSLVILVKFPQIVLWLPGLMK